MPYKKSAARVDLESTINKLSSLAKSTNSISNLVLSYNHKSLIFQSVIVALSSAIEEYHKSVIESMFYKMKANAVAMRQLPLNSRLLNIMCISSECVKDYLFSKDGEANTLAKLTSKKELLNKLIDDNNLFDISWYPKTVIGDKKYPSEKNLITLYARLGVNDIFKTLQIKSHKNYKDLLRSFSDLRTAIAHVGGKDVTYDDVKEQVSFVIDFIYMLDKELYCICSKSAGVVCWPA